MNSSEREEDIADEDLSEENKKNSHLLKQRRKLDSRDIRQHADFLVNNSPGGTADYGKILFPGMITNPNNSPSRQQNIPSDSWSD
jgi:hypothetical protein